MHEQWQLHQRNTNPHEVADMEKLKKANRRFVFATEDHAATKLVLFCSEWMQTLTKSTFEDEAIWRTENVELEEAIDICLRIIPSDKETARITRYNEGLLPTHLTALPTGRLWCCFS